MRKALLAAALLVALLATAAAADVPQVAWFSDNFDAIADGTQLKDAPGWTGSGPENFVYSGAVRLRGYAAVATNSDASNTPTIEALSAGKLQILHARVRGENLGENPGNHAYIYMNYAGGSIGFWYGHSNQLVPRFGGSVGTPVSLTDGLWHDLDIRYNPVDGLTQWVADGTVVWTQTRSVGLAATAVILQDQQRGVLDAYDPVWVDNVALGTVPEPSSMLVLGTFGLGMIGYIKRRRA